MDDKTLTQLVEAARGGDQEAISALYHRTQGPLYFLVWRMTGSRQDALDILQEGYLKAFGSLDTLLDPEKFSGWVTAIVLNTTRSFLRRAGREYPAEDGQMEQEEETGEEFLPHAYAQTQEKREVVLGIIDRLPPAQRTAILLFYYQQLPIAQIAHHMGCTESTVKSRLLYAKRFIRREVERPEGEGDKLYAALPVPVLTLALQQSAATGQLPPAALLEAIRAGLAGAAVAAGAVGTPTGGDAAGGTGSAAESAASAASPSAASPAAGAGSGQAAAGSAQGLAAKLSALSLPAKIGLGVGAAAVVVACVAVPVLLSRGGGEELPVEHGPTPAATLSADGEDRGEPRPWQELYLEYVEERFDEGAEGQSIHAVSLLDIDGDGIPELSLWLGDGDEPVRYQIVSAPDGYLEPFCSDAAHITEVLWDPDNNMVVLQSTEDNEWEWYTELFYLTGEGLWQQGGVYCAVGNSLPDSDSGPWTDELEASYKILADDGEVVEFTSFAHRREAVDNLMEYLSQEVTYLHWQQLDLAGYGAWEDAESDVMAFLAGYDSSADREKSFPMNARYTLAAMADWAQAYIDIMDATYTYGPLQHPEYQGEYAWMDRDEPNLVAGQVSFYRMPNFDYPVLCVSVGVLNSGGYLRYWYYEDGLAQPYAHYTDYSFGNIAEEYKMASFLLLDDPNGMEPVVEWLGEQEEITPVPGRMRMPARQLYNYLSMNYDWFDGEPLEGSGTAYYLRDVDPEIVASYGGPSSWVVYNIALYRYAPEDALVLYVHIADPFDTTSGWYHEKTLVACDSLDRVIQYRDLEYWDSALYAALDGLQYAPSVAITAFGDDTRNLQHLFSTNLVPLGQPSSGMSAQEALQELLDILQTFTE